MARILTFTLTRGHDHVSVQQIDEIIAAADSGALQITLPESIIKCSICYERFMVRLNASPRAKLRLAGGRGNE